MLFCPLGAGSEQGIYAPVLLSYSSFSFSLINTLFPENIVYTKIKYISLEQGWSIHSPPACVMSPMATVVNYTFIVQNANKFWQAGY
jgi:hypothetical protein